MRKISTSVAAITASVALGASALVAGSATPAQAAGCSTNLSSFSSVRQGSSGAAARTVECTLKAAGYATTVNGRISSADVTAIKKFQRAQGISANGIVSRATWTALVAKGSTPYLRYGKTGSAVVRVQRALTAAGFKVSDTGYFGPQTRAAVKRYQRAVGLKVTGTVNASTWAALQKGTVAKAAKKAKKVTTTVNRRATTSSLKTSAKASKAVKFAYRQIGDRYRYGGTGPNAWDCSGLTRGSWKAAGVSIPRTSQAQYSKLRKVKKSQLRPGDIVAFYSGRSHVGIYVGNGYVIHASRPGKPVAKIKMKYMPYAGAVRPA